MNCRAYLPKSGICNFKAHALPQNSLSSTTTKEDRKNTDRNEEKINPQKYLNLYQSIERREQLINDKPKQVNKILSAKKYINQKSGIFENPLIQNSCSQIHNQNPLTQPTFQIIQSHNSLDRKSSIPSKKNQMTLKMIAEHKFFDIDKIPMKSMEKTTIVQGSSITDNKVRNFNIYPLNFQDDFPQTQKNNFFLSEDQKKSYKSYYQSKYQKQYQKPTQRKLRKSHNFIVQVDKIIQKQKNRQEILHPHTFHFNSSSKKDLQNMINSAEEISMAHKTELYPKKNQSSAKLSNKKTTTSDSNKTMNKKVKKYFFHKKSYQPLKSFSYHPEDDKQNHKNFCTLSITTQTPLTKSLFVTSKQQDLVRLQKNFNSYHSKNDLKSKYRKNERLTENFYKKSQNNPPLQKSRIERPSYRMTLNKIQENISNDVQINIRHLDTKF